MLGGGMGREGGLLVKCRSRFDEAVYVQAHEFDYVQAYVEVSKWHER